MSFGRLTQDQIVYILNHAEAGVIELAMRFGVTKQAISWHLNRHKPKRCASTNPRKTQLIPYAMTDLRKYIGDALNNG